MNTLPITPTDITQDPMLVSVGVALSTGESVVLRPLAPNDANVLGVYFLSLSNETKRRYGPHPFDQATADRLCAENDYAHTIRMLATTSDGDERVIAYFILVLGVGENDASRYAKLGMMLNTATDCTLAPSVADDYQDKGLGSVMMRHVLVTARKLSKQRMVLMGGVQATNARAKHFYEKHGFKWMGDFEEPAGRNNHDMILDL